MTRTVLMAAAATVGLAGSALVGLAPSASAEEISDLQVSAVVSADASPPKKSVRSTP